MSLYNELFGINEEAPILLGMIGVNKQYFDRFRDIFLCRNGDCIIVFTRTGGNNRKDYEENWNKIRQNSLYIVDYDDGLDETYAYIEFNIPEKYKETAKKMYKNEPVLVGQKFKKEIEEMKTPGSDASKRAEKMANWIMRQIEENDSGGVIYL